MTYRRHERCTSCRRHDTIILCRRRFTATHTLIGQNVGGFAGNSPSFLRLDGMGTPGGVAQRKSALTGSSDKSAQMTRGTSLTAHSQLLILRCDVHRM